MRPKSVSCLELWTKADYRQDRIDLTPCYTTTRKGTPGSTETILTRRGNMLEIGRKRSKSAESPRNTPKALEIGRAWRLLRHTHRARSTAADAAQGPRRRQYRQQHGDHIQLAAGRRGVCHDGCVLCGESACVRVFACVRVCILIIVFFRVLVRLAAAPL